MKEEAAQKKRRPPHPDPAGISHPRRSLGLARQSSITTAVRLLRGFTLSQGRRAGRRLCLGCGRLCLGRGRLCLGCRRLCSSCGRPCLSCGRLCLSCGRLCVCCGRLGLGCGRLGLGCGRLGLSCGRFGLSCGRLGLSCGRLGLGCGRRRRRGPVRRRVQRRWRLGVSGRRRAGVVICGWGSWPWGGAVFIAFDLGAWRAGQTGFGRLG